MGKSDGSAITILEDITERTIVDVKRMLGLMPLVYEFMSLAFRRKFVKEAFKHYINRFMEILVPVFQYGIDRGEFRPHDPHDIAITFGAIFEGTILLWVYDNTLVDVEKHIRSGIKFLLQGIQA